MFLIEKKNPLPFMIYIILLQVALAMQNIVDGGKTIVHMSGRTHASARGTGVWRDFRENGKGPCRIGSLFLLLFPYRPVYQCIAYEKTR